MEVEKMIDLNIAVFVNDLIKILVSPICLSIYGIGIGALSLRKLKTLF